MQPVQPAAPPVRDNPNSQSIDDYLPKPVVPTTAVGQPPVPSADFSNRVDQFKSAMREQGFDVVVTKQGDGTLQYGFRDPSGVMRTDDDYAKYGYAQGSLIAEKFGLRWGGGQAPGRLDDVAPKAAPAAAAPPLTGGQAPNEPALYAQSTGYQKGRNGYQPQFIILHSTDGSSTQADLNTFTDSKGKVGVHYLIGRDGKVYHLASESDAAKQAGYDKYGNYANDWTIGIEQSHVDRNDAKGIKGEAWTDADIRAAAKTTADIMRRNPQITLDHVLFHSDLAGERKQDPVDYPMQKFYGYVQDELGLPHTAVQKVDYYVPQKPGVPTGAAAAPRAPVAGAPPTVQPPLAARAQYPDLASAAEANVGVLSTRSMPGTEGGSLGCAGGVCKIVHDEMGIALRPTLSTAELYTELRDGGWKEVDPHTPGAVIVSPTVGGTHGHTGIVGSDGNSIYSNSSATGNWEQNYTIDSWRARFSGKGLETHAFLPPSGVAGPPSGVAGPGAPIAQPANKLASGFYQGEDQKSFLSGRVTTFATPDDVASGADTGIGSPRLGKLDTTQVAGVALPEWVLQSQLGSNPAAWRRARVDVVDPSTGRRLRVPIVDLGPRGDRENAGVIGDMSPVLSRYFGGDKNLAIKLVPNAGPDVTRDRGLFYDEQDSIRQGYDSSALVPGVAKVRGLSTSGLGPAVPPGELIQLRAQDAAAQANQRGILSNLPEAKPGQPLGALYKRLDKPVEGVNDVIRKNYQQSIKDIASAYAQDYYGIKDPTEAFKRITSDPNVGTFIGEIATKIPAQINSAITAFNQSGQTVDENRVNQLINIINPKATPEQRVTFLKGILNPDLNPQDRFRLIRDEISVPFSKLDPQVQAAFDLPETINALERMADPQYQAQRQAAIGAQVDKNLRDLRPDPTLNPVAAGAANLLAQIPKVAIEAGLPGGVGAAIGQSLMLSEIYQATQEKVKADHPDWSPEQVKDMVDKSSIMQLAGAEIFNRFAAFGRLGGLTAGVQNPLARIAASALVHSGTGAGAGAAQQIGSNIAEGKEPFEGVGPAAVGGAVLAAPGGVIGGLHPAVPRPEVRPPVPPSEEREPPIVGREAPPVPPVDEQQRQEQIIREPKEPDREPPVQQEPVVQPSEPPQEQHDVQLQNQADDLYNQYKVGDLISPIEERPIPADIVTGEQRPTGELEQPVREAGGELLRPQDVVGEQEQQPPGREQALGGRTVPPELGRVPGALETRLSPEDRAAFKPEVDALENAFVSTPNAQDPRFVAAVRALREKVIARFQPILDAIGVERRPDDEGSFFAAGLRSDGSLSLDSNLVEAARLIRSRLTEGTDPLDYLHSVMQEEVIHFAKHLADVEQWNALGRPGNDATLFQSGQHLGILQDTLRARDEARANGQTRLALDLENALHASLPFYQHEGDLAQKTTREQRESALQAFARNASPDSTTNMVHELVRQLVQIRSGNPTTESFFKRAWDKARNWYEKALWGLGQLGKRLGAGRSLAKSELGRAVQNVEAKLKAIDKLVAEKSAQGPQAPGARGEGAPPEPGITPQAPGAKRTMRERMEDWRRGFGLTFKSGESAMLDYKETRPLAVAIRRMPSEVQRFGQHMRLMQLKGVFDSIPKSERARVIDEFTKYTKAEQKRQPLPPIGQDTMRLIQASKDSLERTGQIMKALGVKVQDGNIIRDVKLIGSRYFPRMISADTRDIFNNRDGSRAQDFNRIVNDTIAKGVVKNRQEFIDKFTHAITGEGGTNDHFSNLEKARKLDLPLDFYDFSPETLLRYLDRANNRLAQISTLGQKLANKGKDVFDTGIEEINKNPDYSYQAKHDIISRINSVRQAQYQRVGNSGAERAMQMGRNLALSAYLGNQGTAIRNLITGAAQNFTFGGPMTFLKTAASFPLNWRASIAEARDRNILRTNLKDVLSDYDLASNPSWLNRKISTLAQKAISFGGHNLTESINRAFAMQQAKLILQDFMRDRGLGIDNPITRQREGWILRRFGTDDPNILGRLARENGSGPLTDEFLRQHVMDIHANYGPGQIPENLVNNAAGRAMFQFQRWGANTARMATREFLMPLARAIKSGDPGEIGYHAVRNIGYLAAAVGAGTAVQGALNALYNRDPKDPTFAEIGKALQNHNYAQALNWFVSRAWGAFIASGFSGLFGDYVDPLQSTLGLGAGEMQDRPKDPFHPPMLSIAEPLIAFANGWRGETLNFTHPSLPSPKLFDTLMRQIVSEYRVAANVTLGLGARFPSLHMPWSDQYAAKQDLNFTRDRIRMFEAQNPVLQQKREAQGTKATALAMSGRGPFDPVRDRIISGLSSGNEHDVSATIRQWMEQVPKAEVKAELDRIKRTISANSPLKVGGSTKPEAVYAFLSWAHDNLPEAETRRIFALASTYAKTAISTGLEERSKGMQQLAKLDYDKFRAPVQSAAQATARQAINERQGQLMLQQMMRQERAAQALRNR
jgi:hypothetical protein